MTAPQALIGLFQQEATASLDGLDESLANTGMPDAATFLRSAGALRRSATMARLDGLTELASTLERIATGVQNAELRWDQRLHLAVRHAIGELRALVVQAPVWSEAAQRRARTQSVSLAAVASGYVTTAPATTTGAPALQVTPIARFFPEDGMPGILHRAPAPATTVAKRFRHDMATAADGVAREIAALGTAAATRATGPSQLASTDGMRRALLGLADLSESYGATSIATLATTMARAPLTTPSERAAVQGFARLLMNRECPDVQLAREVKQASLTWSGAPLMEPPTVPIETLLYRGHSAVVRARDVRNQLKLHWQRGSLAQPEAHVLFEELSDLLDLAVTA